MNRLPRFDRHLTILLITQAIAGSTMPVLFLISGLMGPRLAPSLELSTLPMSLVVIGVALASPLATGVMARTGRKAGHLFGLALTLTGVVIAGFSLWAHSFWAFCFASTVCGIGSAFNNQIRFTAAEGAGEQKALVHSWVLTFSLFAAFLGPWIAEWGHNLLPFGEFTGSVALLIGALILVFLMMLALPRNQTVRPAEVQVSPVRRSEILRDPKFWVGALCGIAAFATMSLLMSATPLQMHEVEHFSVSETTRTIQSHIVAMFLPSLFSGILLTWLGIRRLIQIGVGLFLVCVGIAWYGSHFHHYWWALVLLGIGWNFLFLASSAWISQSFTGPGRFATQGLNDALVFGTQALASLAAGWLLFEVGWKNLVLIPVPILLFLLINSSRIKRA